jgi:hypothetical protein
MWRKVGLVEVEEGTITTRFEYANFDDYWSPFLSGDGPPGQFVMGLTPEQRGMLERQVRHVFLSGRPDGARSFIGAAWIAKVSFQRPVPSRAPDNGADQGFSSITISISTAIWLRARPCRRRHARRGRPPEHLDHEVGEAVDHLGMLAERRRVDYAQH